MHIVVTDNEDIMAGNEVSPTNIGEEYCQNIFRVAILALLWKRVLVANMGASENLLLWQICGCG